MSNPLEDAIIELAKSANPDETKREWLAAVAARPETSDADYSAAEAIMADPKLTADDVEVGHLVKLGIVAVDANRNIAALHHRQWNL